MLEEPCSVLVQPPFEHWPSSMPHSMSARHAFSSPQQPPARQAPQPDCPARLLQSELGITPQTPLELEEFQAHTVPWAQSAVVEHLRRHTLCCSAAWGTHVPRGPQSAEDVQDDVHKPGRFWSFALRVRHSVDTQSSAIVHTAPSCPEAGEAALGPASSPATVGSPMPRMALHAVHAPVSHPPIHTRRARITRFLSRSPQRSDRRRSASLEPRRCCRRWPRA